MALWFVMPVRWFYTLMQLITTKRLVRLLRHTGTCISSLIGQTTVA
jgi:hypothetical protein